MKEIRIFMIHESVHSVQDMIAYLGWEKYLDEFTFVWDEKNPDYVISTEHIYFYDSCKEKFKQLYNVNRVQIAVFSELYMPDFNLFDYATGFYDCITCDDRYVQLLTPDKFFKSFLCENVKPLDSNDAEDELHKKTGFCNFLYSNPKAHPNRDMYFHKLSEYKQVDSLGRWLNNVKQKGTGFVGHANECVSIKSAYKFSIAVENATCKGYLTEKILTSLEAHTIPIYWGDPNVTKLINSNCFINCHDYETVDDVIEKVKEIDNNDKEWCNIITQPWYTEKNIAYKDERNKKYYEFWKNIFVQNIKEAKRIAIGYHPDNYLKWFKTAEPIFHKKLYSKFFNSIITVLKKIKS